MNQQPNQSASNSKPKATYQAPRIETVITAKELERELFYAGQLVSTPA